MPIKDPDARREYNKQWHLANRESELEKSKKWHRENREASNAHTNKYISDLRALINDHKKAGACIRCGIADYVFLISTISTLAKRRLISIRLGKLT